MRENGKKERKSERSRGRVKDGEGEWRKERGSEERKDREKAKNIGRKNETCASLHEGMFKHTMLVAAALCCLLSIIIFFFIHSRLFTFRHQWPMFLNLTYIEIHTGHKGSL